VEFEGDELNGCALNLCSRVPLTARELVAATAAELRRPLEYHPRPLPLLYASELAKWSVKKLMRRRDLLFPAYGELAARSLPVPFASGLARSRLNWQPVDDPNRFLELAIGTAGAAASRT
jgi:hypothetical protein